MQGKRVWQTIRLYLTPSPRKRANYLKGVYRSVGDNCVIMSRRVPLYPELISIGNNVKIASNVYIALHDATHMVINNIQRKNGRHEFAKEKIGCIKIGDNVFIGSGTRILGDVEIGSNVVIGANSLVNKDIPDNSVAAGVPVHVIGTFDDFMKKRLNEEPYPKGLRKGKENLNPAFADYLWKQFEEKRRDKKQL